MNESSFRQLLHKEIGDSDPRAHLTSQTRVALKQSFERPSARQHDGLIVIAALLATFAVLAALLVPRLFTHIQQPVGVSSPSPSPLTPSPPPADATMAVTLSRKHVATFPSPPNSSCVLASGLTAPTPPTKALPTCLH